METIFPRNPTGESGFSYCLTSATQDDRTQFTKHITPWMNHVYEVLAIPIDTSMQELFQFCRYDWVMKVKVSCYNTSPDYNPKVSIILPTYKRPHTLPRTVESIISQGHTNWELIVVNNDINQVTVTEDPRIAVYNHSEEANACYARNEGVRHATGDLVCFFDDDDIMLPDYLSKMAEPFYDDRIKMVRCGMAIDNCFVDFSYSTQEVWVRRESATPTWEKGNINPCHDEIYYRHVARDWPEASIVQTGLVLVKAGSDSVGGLRATGHGGY